MARRSWSAGTIGATTTGTVATTSATVPDETKVVRDVAESFRSDAAQQVSAWAWVTWCPERRLCDSDLCIGQLVPFVQHAIRASGVACQPAQTARCPTQSVRTAIIAASRRLTVTTLLGCWTRRAVSNPARWHYSVAYGHFHPRNS